jgi:transmembrane sensor
MQDKIHYILDNGKSSTASQKEEQKMFALFHEAENEYELKGLLLNELQETKVQDASSPYYKRLFNKLWKKVENITSPKASKTRFLTAFSKIAAAIIIGVLAGFYISSRISVESPIYYSAHSPKGSVSEILLPDSSVIFLNADSKIKYSFNGEKGIREVFLNGEAWFDVHKNKEKPFVVHTTYYDVNVTGTQFNVKAYETDNKVTTTLEEGSVCLGSTENCKLEDAITLVPGEQAIFDTETKNIAIKTVNTNWFTSWKDNKLVFVNMSLKELIVLLERRYGVDIEVKNNKLLDLHFDGTIKNESIIEILEIIKKTLPVNYNIEGQKIEITTKQT